MQDLFLARPWETVRQMATERSILCTAEDTCAPRSFFPVDAEERYVVRVRCGANCMVTLTPAPARSAAVAAYEENLR